MRGARRSCCPPAGAAKTLDQCCYWVGVASAGKQMAWPDCGPGCHVVAKVSVTVANSAILAAAPEKALPMSGCSRGWYCR